MAIEVSPELYLSSTSSYSFPFLSGLYSSVSPPLVSQPPQHRYGRSLSEARFNALRQEFQEYRRAQESYSRDPCTPPDPDSDSSSALLWEPYLGPLPPFNPFGLSVLKFNLFLTQAFCKIFPFVGTNVHSTDVLLTVHCLTVQISEKWNIRI